METLRAHGKTQERRRSHISLCLTWNVFLKRRYSCVSDIHLTYSHINWVRNLHDPWGNIFLLIYPTEIYCTEHYIQVYHVGSGNTHITSLLFSIQYKYGLSSVWTSFRFWLYAKNHNILLVSLVNVFHYFLRASLCSSVSISPGSFGYPFDICFLSEYFSSEITN